MPLRKIYVASSWRNEYYYGTVEFLRKMGHQVWDWRNPPTGGSGFSWQQAGHPDYQHGDVITAKQWHETLQHPVAQAGFASDLAGMHWCDVGVLLHPCGRSAHMEAGFLAGMGKKVHVLAPDDVEPDLMVLLFNGGIFSSWAELGQRLERDV